VQDTQHCCGRNNRTHRFARIALAEFVGNDPVSDRSSRLGFASLCVEGVQG